MAALSLMFGAGTSTGSLGSGSKGLPGLICVTANSGSQKGRVFTGACKTIPKFKPAMLDQVVV